MRLEVGCTYVNRSGDEIVITRSLEEGEPGYNQGFRFVDNQKNTYTKDGKWSVLKKKTDKDLVNEFRL